MYFKSILTILIVAWFVSCVSTRERVERSHGLAKSRHAKEDLDYSNEISDDSTFKLDEPYISLVQTTARFALAQSRIANVLNMDTAMNLLNRAARILAKKANLAKAIKAIAIISASLITSNIFFPATFTFVERLWQDPIHTLNLDGYLSNGVSERSVIDILSLRADKTMDRMGLGDSQCRERSLCYTGELLKCVFPTSSEMVTRFITDNFAQGTYRDNKYFKAFSSGLVDQNCTRSHSDGPEPRSCLGKFVISLFAADPEVPVMKSDLMAPQEPGPRNSRQILHAMRS